MASPICFCWDRSPCSISCSKCRCRRFGRRSRWILKPRPCSAGIPVCCAPFTSSCGPTRAGGNGSGSRHLRGSSYGCRHLPRPPIGSLNRGPAESPAVREKAALGLSKQNLSNSSRAILRLWAVQIRRRQRPPAVTSSCVKLVLFATCAVAGRRVPLACSYWPRSRVGLPRPRLFPAARRIRQRIIDTL